MIRGLYIKLSSIYLDIELISFIFLQQHGLMRERERERERALQDTIKQRTTKSIDRFGKQKSDSKAGLFQNFPCPVAIFF